MNLLKNAILSSGIVICSSLSAFAAHNITNLTTVNICQNNVSTDVMYSATLNYLQSGNVSVTVYFGDGQSATYNNLTSTQLNGSHTYDLHGKYTMKFVVSDNGVKESDYSIQVDAFCQYVTLATFYDADNDCKWSGIERKIAENTEVEVECDGMFEKRIFLGDKYTYEVKENKNYKFKFLNSSLGTFTACMGKKETNLTVPTGFNDSNLYLGINCGTDTRHDFQSYINARVRVSNSSYLTLYCRNLSCNSNAAQAMLTIDPRFDFVSASVVPVSVKNNIVTWNVADLSILKSQKIEVSIKPKAGVTLTAGTGSYSSLKMLPTTDDANEGDNNCEDTTIIVSGWDPNEILVKPGGYITAGQKLDYTINFENLGNDTAFNIHVLDTLSEYYDLKSFKLIASSHPVNAGLVDGDNGKVIARFEFPNINLADSTDKDHNKGYVRYTVDAKTTLPPNTIINNRAGIYFDVNPVVMTNTAHSIIAPLSVHNASVENNVQVYPNPAKNILYVQTTDNTYTKVEILNGVGQKMLTTDIKNGMNTISTSQLAAGIYHLLLYSNDGVKAMKIEKQ